MRGSGVPILIFSIVFVIGCSVGSGNRPPLTQSQMVPVIYELMLSEEYATQHNLKDSSMPVPEFRDEKYDQVFSLHKIDQKAFSTSYKYYLGHPDEMKAIYDSVHSMATRKRMDIMHSSARSREKVKVPVKKKVVDSL